MINIELGTPKNFNPECIDSIELNNILTKQEIEKQINYKLETIDRIINIVMCYKEPTLSYTNITVLNDKCKASYALVYTLNTKESIHINIIEHGNEFTYTITVKNKNLIEYTVINKNHVRLYPDDLSDTVDDTVEFYQIIKDYLK